MKSATVLACVSLTNQSVNLRMHLPPWCEWTAFAIYSCGTIQQVIDLASVHGKLYSALHMHTSCVHQ